MTHSITRRQSVVGLALLPALAGSGARGAEVGASPNLSRGLSLHHMLNWPDAKAGPSGLTYAWPPFADARFQISDAELARLKTAGFKAMRVTADPSIWLASAPDRQAELLKIAMGVVRRLIGAGFAVVYDLHPVAVNPDWRPERLVATGPSPAFMAYADLVERLARAFRELPPEKFAFEVFNEPAIASTRDVPRWQPMMELLHARARAGAPDLPLVLTGAQWGSHRALMRLDTAPFQGSNVLYTFHFYEPAAFTHQAVPNSDWQYIKGLSWPPKQSLDAAVAAATTRVQADARLDDAAKGRMIAATRKLLTDYFAGSNDVAQIRAEFQKVADWAKANRIPANRIFLGEFGVVRPDDGVDNGWLAWLRAMRETADGFGFGWALWAYKGWGGMSLTGDAVKTVPQADMLQALGLRA